MFTGLVDATGAIRSRVARGPGFALRFECPYADLAVGESVCVNGACLTVTEAAAGGFCADISTETARATTLGTLPIGTATNFERALKLGDRLGGHLVTGHVDGVTTVLSSAPEGDAACVWLALPEALARFVAAKGSITLDGVSLTVNEVVPGRCSVMLIPHTRAATTLGAWRTGLVVNLEVDTVARYVARQLSPELAEAQSAPLLEKLRAAGFAP